MTTRVADIKGLAFDPPGPGAWERDLTHFPRPVPSFMTAPDVFEEPMARGFTWTARRYGLLIRQLDERFVNGYAYINVPPVGEEELPERFANAAAVFEEKLWREDLRQWDEEAKPASIRAHLALQRVDPWMLDRDALLEHVAACRSHLQRMTEQHFRFTAPAIVPLGDFLVRGGELSGASPAELLVLTRGSARVSAGALDGLEQLAETIREDDEAVAMLGSGDPAAEVLAALRRWPGRAGTAVRGYLEMTECRLLDGFDIGCPCAFEMPDVVVGAIRAAKESEERDRDAEADTARVRDCVPGGERDRFDELLAEARLTYRLRDERSVYSDVWAFGLMRRAILAAGERLAAEERIDDPSHLLDARFAEIDSLLREGQGPSKAELSERARFRTAHNSADTPRWLGDEPAPPPPLDGLPEPAARATRAAGTCVQLLFTDAEAISERAVVRGLPASHGVYEGTARLIDHPKELGRLVQGDVLVAVSTSEAFNLVLPLVGAIVTDNGGLLSHAAIVSREFGIPGVVGTRDATRLISDGARVRVDGGAGEVTVIS
jgi:rifampicin phosphotransferase